MNAALQKLRHDSMLVPGAAIVAMHVALGARLIRNMDVAQDFTTGLFAYPWLWLVTAVCSVSLIYALRTVRSVWGAVFAGLGGATALGWGHALVSVIGIMAFDGPEQSRQADTLFLVMTFGAMYSLPAGFVCGLASALPLGLAAHWRSARFVDGATRIHVSAALTAIAVGGTILYFDHLRALASGIPAVLAVITGLVVLARGLGLAAAHRHVIRELASGANPEVRIMELHDEAIELPLLRPSDRRATHAVFVPSTDGASPYRSEPGWQPVARVSVR